VIYECALVLEFEGNLGTLKSGTKADIAVFDFIDGTITSYDMRKRGVFWAMNF
jgi:predicted amidohydrolase